MLSLLSVIYDYALRWLRSTERVLPCMKGCKRLYIIAYNAYNQKHKPEDAIQIHDTASGPKNSSANYMSDFSYIVLRTNETAQYST